MSPKARHSDPQTKPVIQLNSCSFQFNLSNVTEDKNSKKTYDSNKSISKHSEVVKSPSINQIKVANTNPDKPNPPVKQRIIGTPDYIAPEIINGISTENFGIDWWAVGCIMYEFICGLAPFNAPTVDQIFKNVNDLEIEWPEIGEEEDMMSPEAYDLITKL